MRDPYGSTWNRRNICISHIRQPLWTLLSPPPAESAFCFVAGTEKKDEVVDIYYIAG